MVTVNYRGFTATARDKFMIMYDTCGHAVARDTNWHGQNAGRFKEAVLKKDIDDYIRLAPYFCKWEDQQQRY